MPLALGPPTAPGRWVKNKYREKNTTQWVKQDKKNYALTIDYSGGGNYAIENYAKKNVIFCDVMQHYAILCDIMRHYAILCDDEILCDIMR